MIFKIDLDRPVKEINSGVNLIPAFRELNDKSMKYIILMYDYDSPYCRLPHKIRKSQVLISLGYVNKETIRKFFYKNKEAFPAAIERFQKLQYSPIHENLISVKQQLAEFDVFLRKKAKNPSEMSLAQRIVKDLPDLHRKMQEMEELIGYREALDDEDEGVVRTTLEDYNEGQEALKK